MISVTRITHESIGNSEPPRRPSWSWNVLKRIFIIFRFDLFVYQVSIIRVCGRYLYYPTATVTFSWRNTDTWKKWRPWWCHRIQPAHDPTIDFEDSFMSGYCLLVVNGMPIFHHFPSCIHHFSILSQFVIMEHDDAFGESPVSPLCQAVARALAKLLCAVARAVAELPRTAATCFPSRKPTTTLSMI